MSENIYKKILSIFMIESNIIFFYIISNDTEHNKCSDFSCDRYFRIWEFFKFDFSLYLWSNFLFLYR